MEPYVKHLQQIIFHLFYARILRIKGLQVLSLVNHQLDQGVVTPLKF